MFRTRLPFPEGTELLQTKEQVGDLDLSYISFNVCNLYNELMVFIGELSGKTSHPNPTKPILHRLTPNLGPGPQHVPSKSHLLTSDLKKMCFSSILSRPIGTDLATFLADYHLPFLVGHAMVMRKNPPRNKMQYFLFDSLYPDDEFGTNDSALGDDIEDDIEPIFRYFFIYYF